MPYIRGTSEVLQRTFGRGGQGVEGEPAKQLKSSIVEPPCRVAGDSCEAISTSLRHGGVEMRVRCCCGFSGVCVCVFCVFCERCVWLCGSVARGAFCASSSCVAGAGRRVLGRLAGLQRDARQAGPAQFLTKSDTVTPSKDTF